MNHLTAHQQEAVHLLQQVLGINSVTGHEVELAEFLAHEFSALSPTEVVLQKDEEFRANVLAHWDAGTPAVLLLAHLDTVSVQGWQEYWDARSENDPRRDPFAGAVVDDLIWGRGAGDTKGGIATVLAALQLLKESNTALAKSVVVAFVSDEESGEPGLGLSLGIKAAVPHLARMTKQAPLAVYLEPTNLQVYTAQMGFQIAEVSVTGRTAYFGRPELGADALQGGAAVLHALSEHAHEIAQGEAHPLIGAPNLLVYEFQSGGFIAVPGNARMNLIRKVPPNHSMDEAMEGIANAVSSAQLPEGVNVDVQFTAPRDHVSGGTPTDFDPQIPAISHLRSVIQQVLPQAAQVEGAPYWSEAPIIAKELGIPCVYWAAGDISNCHTPEERVAVKDYVDAIQALALFLSQPWPEEVLVAATGPGPIRGTR